MSKSIAELVAANATAKKDKEKQVKELLKGGWRLLSDSNEYLTLKSDVSLDSPESVLNFAIGSSKGAIFTSFWTEGLIGDLLKDITVSAAGTLVSFKGNRRTSRICLTKRSALEFLAIRVFIHGNQLKKTSQTATILDSWQQLSDKSGITLTGKKKMVKYASIFDFGADSKTMSQLDDHFRRAISRLGEILCCDEKLF